VEYHKELCTMADELGLEHATSKSIATALAISSTVRVIFLLSVPNAVKTKLLQSARVLVYTPRNEHLGIVPLEAMLAGVPVLAADEGGPRETVVDGQTGWLCSVDDVDQWSHIMRQILDGSIDDAAWQKMGHQGRHRVKALFSKEKMALRLDEELKALALVQRPPFQKTLIILGVGGILLGWLILKLIGL
jgi:alpha-1,3/alpha-1,6-mannosyltransferase